MQDRPLLSVIIPTYNRPGQLAACLEALYHQGFPRDRFEVLVVGDGGGGSAETVVASFRGRMATTFLTQPRCGPGTARNTGATHARGQFLVFVDDDCLPTPEWLRAIAGHFARCPDHVVGGRTLNALPSRLCATASHQLSAYVHAYYNTRLTQARFFASNNLALPTGKFRAIGGFDDIFGATGAEDRELCDRWLHYGYAMTYVPEAVVYHARELTLPGFFRQHFNYGRGAFFFHTIRARRNHSRILFEPPAFYLALLWFPFSETPGWRAPLVSILLGVALAASAAGFWFQRITAMAQRRSPAQRPVQPPVGPCGRHRDPGTAREPEHR